MFSFNRFLLIVSALLALYVCVAAVTLYPGLSLIFFVAAIIAVRKHRAFTSCGSARWAETMDVRNAGLLRGPNGLMVGQLMDRPGKRMALRGLFNPRMPSKEACRAFVAAFRRTNPNQRVYLNRTPHIACFAPTGVGKGTSCIVPFLMTCPESCVVIDIKGGENARLTADYRRKKFGHTTVLLDPFHCVTSKPDSLNPLDFIDRSSPYAIDDCREIAAAMVERTGEKGDGIHFLDNAEAGIAGISATVVQFAEPKDKHLQSLCDIIGNPTKWTQAIELMCGSDAWDGLLARMGGNLSHLRDRELASTMSTTTRFVRFLSTPAIAACTRKSSFNPSALLQGKLTIYLILPPERVSALTPLLRLWISTFLRAVVRGGLQGKTKVHFVCDEANSLGGRMDQISDALTVGRGAGIRMQLYYQDMGQLRRCWPDGADQTLLANVSQVFFGVNDLETAKYVSERIGKHTLVVTSGGTSSGTSRQVSGRGEETTSYSTNRNDNWSQQGRELLKPEEILALPERTALVFTPGMPPIRTHVLRYYERGFKEGRVGPVVKTFLWTARLFICAAFFACALTGMVATRVQPPQASSGKQLAPPSQTKGGQSPSKPSKRITPSR